MKKVPTARDDYLAKIPTHNIVQRIHEEWDIPITVHR